MNDVKKRYVYKFTFPNGKLYFGSTHNITERWRGNGDGYANMPVYDAIKKFGWENVKKEVVLFLSDDDETIRRVENALIKEHGEGCYNYMCNPSLYHAPTGIGKVKHVWTIDGITKSGKEWCSIYNRNLPQTIEKMRRYGMSPLEALTCPIVPNGSRKNVLDYWKRVGFEFGNDKRSYVTPTDKWPSCYIQRS